MKRVARTMMLLKGRMFRSSCTFLSDTMRENGEVRKFVKNAKNAENRVHYWPQDQKVQKLPKGLVSFDFWHKQPTFKEDWNGGGSFATWSLSDLFLVQVGWLWASCWQVVHPSGNVASTSHATTLCAYHIGETDLSIKSCWRRNGRHDCIIKVEGNNLLSCMSLFGLVLYVNRKS